MDFFDIIGFIFAAVALYRVLIFLAPNPAFQNSETALSDFI